jgi:uncharacterized protein (TIGR00255 family)
MTGYGSAQHVANGTSYALELRSVNHRYLKLHIRLPEHLQALESVVEKLIQSRISRGSVACGLAFRSEQQAALRNINVAALQQYVERLTAARLPGGVQPTIDLAALALLPGVCEPIVLDDEAREAQIEILTALVEKATGELIEMRRQEGQALRADLLQHTAAIRAAADRIEARAPRVLDEYHERLKARVASLMRESKVELEADGLAREVAIYAERSDIGEELARLRSHLDQFATVCDRDAQAGRTLEFLAQEMLREVNTIGSKSNDADIARNVVTLKGLIDRIKEQVQNVE